MAIGEAFNAWRRGEGFEKAFGYLALSQEEIDRGRDLTNRWDAENRRAFDAGYLSEKELIERNARLHTSDIENLLTNPDSSPLAGFQEGLKEGASNVQSVIKESIRAPITWGLGTIPWQAWLIVALVVGWKFGLFNRLKSSSA